MPQLRGLDSLQDICLSNIADNIEFWCSDYIKNWQKVEFQYIHTPLKGPFHTLPSSLIELVLLKLNETGKIQKHHLHVLAVEYLQKFYLMKETHNINTSVILLGKRCKRLKKLHISNCNISRHYLSEALKDLPELEIIELPKCNIYDQTVSIIATYCNYVRELVLSETDVTDFGVFSLLNGIEDLEITPSFKPKLCSTLERIDLEYTGVTSNGITALLQHIPNLKYLRSGLLLYSIYELVQQHSRKLSLSLKNRHDSVKKKEFTLPVLKLRNIDHVLHWDDCNSENSYLTIGELIHMCPDAEIFKFIGYPNVIWQSAFHELTSMSLLTELELVFVCDERLYFHVLLLPFLDCKGRMLRALKLSMFAQVDIRVLCRKCPNLIELSLFDNSYLLNNNIHSCIFTPQSPLQRLQMLKIGEFTSGLMYNDPELWEISPEERLLPSASDLVLLLSCPVLEKLYFTQQHCLNDKVVNKVLRKNNLPNLTFMSFSYCYEVTAEAIQKFLELRNPLKTLKLKECFKIKEQDILNFNHYVWKKGYDVVIEWK